MFRCSNYVYVHYWHLQETGELRFTTCHSITYDRLTPTLSYVILDILKCCEENLIRTHTYEYIPKKNIKFDYSFSMRLCEDENFDRNPYFAKAFTNTTKVIININGSLNILVFLIKQYDDLGMIDMIFRLFTTIWMPFEVKGMNYVQKGLTTRIYFLIFFMCNFFLIFFMCLFFKSMVNHKIEECLGLSPRSTVTVN